MKVALDDKKAVSAFLDKKPYEGVKIFSSGGELRAVWGDKPLISKWDRKGKLIQIPSRDKGVRKVQELVEKQNGG